MIRSAILAASALCMLAMPAAAEYVRPTQQASIAPYDGAWSVNIQSTSGSCDAAAINFQISNNRVVSDSAGASVSGDVAGNGAINVTLTNRRGRATGSGRLGQSSGSGTWAATGNMCAGTWVAQRN